MGLSFLIIVLGLVLGSFLHTMAIRLQNRESLIIRSSCDHCRKPVGPIGLIPVFGYLLLRGKCKSCGGKITPFYPLFETFNAAFIWLIFSKTGWNIDFIHLCLLFEVLLLVALIDIRSHLIFPQPIIVGLALQSGWYVFYAQAEALNGIFGLFLGAGIFHWVSYLYLIFRKKNGLGAGDATLLGLLGFFFGWSVIFPIIFWSAALGILGGGTLLAIKRQSLSKEIAFGPWLVLASFLVWRFPEIFLAFPIALPDFSISSL